MPISFGCHSLMSTPRTPMKLSRKMNSSQTYNCLPTTGGFQPYILFYKTLIHDLKAMLKIRKQAQAASCYTVRAQVIIDMIRTLTRELPRSIPELTAQIELLIENTINQLDGALPRTITNWSISLLIKGIRRAIVYSDRWSRSKLQTLSHHQRYISSHIVTHSERSTNPRTLNPQHHDVYPPRNPTATSFTFSPNLSQRRLTDQSYHSSRPLDQGRSTERSVPRYTAQSRPHRQYVDNVARLPNQHHPQLQSMVPPPTYTRQTHNLHRGNATTYLQHHDVTLNNAGIQLKYYNHKTHN